MSDKVFRAKDKRKSSSPEFSFNRDKLAHDYLCALLASGKFNGDIDSAYRRAYRLAYYFIANA